MKYHSIIIVSCLSNADDPHPQRDGCGVQWERRTFSRNYVVFWKKVDQIVEHFHIWCHAQLWPYPTIYLVSASALISCLMSDMDSEVWTQATWFCRHGNMFSLLSFQEKDERTDSTLRLYLSFKNCSCKCLFRLRRQNEMSNQIL